MKVFLFRARIWPGNAPDGSQQLNELLNNHRKDGSPTVALLDGTLASWDKAGSAKGFRRFYRPYYVDVFKTGERLGIPVAGYISGSRTALVINTLRSGDCSQPVMNCVNCEHRIEPQAPCRRLEGLRDVTLFKNILNPGERSVCFYGGINTLPRNEWPSYRIGFFYINVGSEVARWKHLTMYWRTRNFWTGCTGWFTIRRKREWDIQWRFRKPIILPWLKGRNGKHSSGWWKDNL